MCTATTKTINSPKIPIQFSIFSPERKSDQIHASIALAVKSHSWSRRHYNSHSLQIHMNKSWYKRSYPTRILMSFIHSPADHTNLFVTLGSHICSPGDVPSGNPRKTRIWMNYSRRGFQWSIHSSGYLCNFWCHHNQEKRNSHLRVPSGFHHKLQKQNIIYFKTVIILVWRKILPLFIQICSCQQAHVLIRPNFSHHLPIL